MLAGGAERLKWDIKKVLRNKKVEQKVSPVLVEPSASSFDRVRHLGAVGSKNFVRLIKTEMSDGRRVSNRGGGEGAAQRGPTGIDESQRRDIGRKL